jgi:hypothetical protein
MLNVPANFRLLVRLVGIAAFAFALPQIAHLLYWLGQVLWTADSAGVPQLTFFDVLSYFIAPLAQCAIGFYLLFGADGLIRYCLQEVRECCTLCGYATKGLSSPVCPECGEIIHTRPAPAFPMPSAGPAAPSESAKDST